MYIPFKQMPKNARIWIYQSDKSFSQNDEDYIATLSKNFMTEWAAHGTPLNGSFEIFHHKFLVISVDEDNSKASGCSIDASVGLIRTIESKLKLSFFDRSKIAFLINEEVFLHDMSNIKALVTEGAIKTQTLTFNNLVEDISQFEKQWIVPAGKSWLKRYF